ncbi:hypothetical protein PMAYCL1PPCAC_13712, partial [Pristionchus mayeri]
LTLDSMEEFTAAIQRAITEVSKDWSCAGLWPTYPCVHLLYQEVTCLCDSETASNNDLPKNGNENSAEGVAHWIGKYTESEKRR